MKNAFSIIKPIPKTDDHFWNVEFGVMLYYHIDMLYYYIDIMIYRTLYKKNIAGSSLAEVAELSFELLTAYCDTTIKITFYPNYAYLHSLFFQKFIL